jgi:CHAT domain-containing protein/tetratricopeptide (TPR) repeat protein
MWCKISTLLASVCSVVAVIFTGMANAQSVLKLETMTQEISELRSQWKYADAIVLAKRAVAETEGKSGLWLITLADLQSDAGQHVEAEGNYKLAIGVYTNATPRDESLLANTVESLANQYRQQGRMREAEQIFEHVIKFRQNAVGISHPDFAASLNNLGQLYHAQGRHSEAEQAFQRSFSIWQQAPGTDAWKIYLASNNLANLYGDLGRFSDAEQLHNVALTVLEGSVGRDHPNVGTSLGNYASLLAAQERYAEAEPLVRRALAIMERALGQDHPAVGLQLNNLANLTQSQRRFAEAEPLYRRALANQITALGHNHSDVALTLDNLATLKVAQGHSAEAEHLHLRALAIREKILGADHPRIAHSLNNLAILLQRERRFVEADPLMQRALGIFHSKYGPLHPKTGMALNNLAASHFMQGDRARAVNYWRRSTLTSMDRSSLYLLQSAERENLSQIGRLHGLVKASNWLANDNPGSQESSELKQEMFQVAQRALATETSASLAQMAARSASSSGGLSQLTRERQDLIRETDALYQMRNTAIARSPEQRNAEVEAVNAARVIAVDNRLQEIDRRLRIEFPDYASLANPEPLSVEQVQANLRADEALVLLLVTPEMSPAPEETFVWIVTKSGAWWRRADIGPTGLAKEVLALRCGLDATAWVSVACANLTGKPYTAGEQAAGAPLPFDHGRSHRLYETLFGDAKDLLKDKHLLLVPSGALAQLPFQVLVTTTPIGADHRSAQWLARDHAITVLPAVSSLKALRRTGKPSAATKPMLGVGNPLLDGQGRDDAERASLAREKQVCQETIVRRIANALGLRSSQTTVAMRSGLADVAQIRAASPLPETADELCAVARDLGADLREVLLGGRATERAIKALSATGMLADYRILHFATHGAIAGQLNGSNEPGLILTPPQVATEEDDGYLTASEIAGLKLDADWVILSACNTAAGGASSTEALSGLARAFFYAQARALLVSHWEVNSDATVKLITTAVSTMSRDKSVGRSEALRRAMLAMIDHGKPGEAHPSYWAPFIVVGEGASVE